MKNKQIKYSYFEKAMKIINNKVAKNSSICKSNMFIELSEDGSILFKYKTNISSNEVILAKVKLCTVSLYPELTGGSCVLIVSII